MIRRVAAVLALLVGLPCPAPAGDADAADLREVRSDHGFEVTRPSAAWDVGRGVPFFGLEPAISFARCERRSQAAFSVFTMDVPPGTTGEDLREETVRRLGPGRGLRGTVMLGGSPVPALSFDAPPLRRWVFLSYPPDGFVLECAASITMLGEHEREFDRTLASFRRVAADDAQGRRRDLRLVAARSVDEAPAADTWEEASSRASAESRLVMVLATRGREGAVADRLSTHLLAHEDLADLCRERMVILPWWGPVGAPFEDPSVYGLGAQTGGSGVLFVRPDGRVVETSVSCDPFDVEDGARRALAACPEALGAPYDPSDLAAALRRGDLERAERLAEVPQTAEAWRLRATLMLRLRRPQEALVALDHAALHGLDEKVVAIERGVVHARCGEWRAAEDAFWSARPRVRAQYEHGRAWMRIHGMGYGRRELESVVSADPASRYAWRAAAILLRWEDVEDQRSESALGFPSWPRAPMQEALTTRRRARAPGDRFDASEAAKAFLLRTQEPDGLWAVPDRGFPDVAVAVLAARALLPYRDEPEVDLAIDRVRRLLPDRSVRLMRWRNPWLPVCMLSLVGPLAEEEPTGTDHPMRDLAANLLWSLRTAQRKDAGWAYDAELGDRSSQSFLTAAALLAIVEARDAGLPAPATIVHGPAKRLTAARRPEGWLYAFDRTAVEPGTAARGVICALALERAGQGIPGEVERRLEEWLTWARDAWREAGKSLYHTAPDGTASYYLLFSARYAAEAAARLPDPRRSEVRRAILDLVLRLRREDGSFVDSPAVGPAYGTAMALRILDLLR